MREPRIGKDYGDDIESVYAETDQSERLKEWTSDDVGRHPLVCLIIYPRQARDLSPGSDADRGYWAVAVDTSGCIVLTTESLRPTETDRLRLICHEVE